MLKNLIIRLFGIPKIMEDEIPHLYKRYYFIYWMIAIFVPLWGLVLNYYLPNIYDPISHRLVTAILPLASAYFSQKYNFSYPKRYVLFMINIFVLNINLLWITATTGNHPMYVIGIYLTFIATGMFFDNAKTLSLFVLSMIGPLIIFNGSVAHSSIPISFIYFLFLSGAIINYFGLTDRFQLITKLRNLNAEIRQKSMQIDQERINTFNASKLASLGDMAGNIAHEINNPLAIIQGFARKLKRAIGEQKKISNEDSIKTLDQIIETTERIAQIIHRLKKLTRPRTNDEMTLVSPLDLVESVAGFFDNRFQSEHIKYRNDINYEMLKNTSIFCRQVDIYQILINLINNAIYAAKENSNRETEVILGCTCDNNYIYFSIADSGLGISKDILDKIYEPFFTTKQEIKAAGLGLSITKTVVEDNQGIIYLDRSVGFTKFIIKFKKVMEKTSAI